MSNVKRLPLAETPREGVHLTLGNVATDLGVSITQMADFAGMSRRSMQRVITENVWPVRMEREPVKQALCALLADRGASEEQVRALFKPYDTRAPKAPRAATHSRIPTGAAQPPEEINMLMPKQSLSPAARRAWALFTNPFDGEVVTDAQMFVNPEIAYVREAAYQAAVGGRFVAIVGESGSGKSTLVEDMEARIERDRKPVRVIRPSVVGMEAVNRHGNVNKSAELLQAIVTAMDPQARAKPSLQGRTEQVTKLLTTSAEAGYQHLLLIEEAHSLSDITLKQCKRLNEIKVGRKVLLGVMLLAQTELAQRLDPRRPELREVTQRCELVHLLPLDNDLQAYLEHRAQAAGRKLTEFFDLSAIDEIRARLTVKREVAGGKAKATSLLYPLTVNNLVTACLNMAADLGAPLVDRNIVRAA